MEIKENICLWKVLVFKIYVRGEGARKDWAPK